MHFGRPVVPLENRMNPGCANDRGTGSRGRPRCGASQASHVTWPACSSPTTTTVVTVGRPARISGSRPRQSMGRPAVRVAGREHEDCRLDLPEAVDDADRPEVRRRRAHDRADAQGAQREQCGLDRVGRPRGDAVSLPHPGRAQCSGHGCGLGPHLRHGELAPAPVLVDPDHGGRRRSAGEEGVDDVQPGVREEARPEEALALDGDVTRIADDAQVVPGLAPEPPRVLHRPGVQLRGSPSRRAGRSGRPAPSPPRVSVIPRPNHAHHPFLPESGTNRRSGASNSASSPISPCGQPVAREPCTAAPSRDAEVPRRRAPATPRRRAHARCPAGTGVPAQRPHRMGSPR